MQRGHEVLARRLDEPEALLPHAFDVAQIVIRHACRHRVTTHSQTVVVTTRRSQDTRLNSCRIDNTLKGYKRRRFVRLIGLFQFSYLLTRNGVAHAGEDVVVAHGECLDGGVDLGGVLFQEELRALL